MKSFLALALLIMLLPLALLACGEKELDTLWGQQTVVRVRNALREGNTSQAMAECYSFYNEGYKNCTPDEFSPIDSLCKKVSDGDYSGAMKKAEDLLDRFAEK